MNTDPYEAWVEALIARSLKELTLREVGRALKQLTQDYVQQRHRLAEGVFEGRGKRAAFAMYYGTRHFLLVREVLRKLAAPVPAGVTSILDLGCGTGVAGAAWGIALAEQTGARPPNVLGCDTADWAIEEARHTFRDLGLRGGALKTDLSRLRWPKGPLCVIAAFTANEISDAQRKQLQGRLIEEAAHGGQVLLLEPLARPITKAWWDDWAAVFKKHGGRADEWHFDLPLPERIHVLGKAAGLNPRELGARTLWLAGKQ